MSNKANGGMTRGESRSLSHLLRNTWLSKCFAFVFVFTPGLSLYSRIEAQIPDDNSEKFKDSFSESHRKTRVQSPLVHEVKTPLMEAFSPPPELFPSSHSTIPVPTSYPVTQITPPMTESPQPWVTPRGTVTAPNYAPASYIPGLKPIGVIDISIAPKAKGSDSTVPQRMVHLDNAAKSLGNNNSLLYATNDYGLETKRDMVAYQPLYFEEVNLERYGRYRPGQAFLSIGRFFGTIPTLPYQMVVYDPRKPLYWNWPHQAGWGAPRVRERPPFRWNALTIEAISLTGAAALIP